MSPGSAPSQRPGRRAWRPGHPGFPRLLTGPARVREWFDDTTDCLRIDVDVANPLIGHLFGYQGSFTIEHIERLGSRYVLWRTAEDVHAAPAQCPHRGANRGDGTVRNGCLTCPYHRIEFATDGAAVHRPAQGNETRIPTKANVGTIAAIKAHGYVSLGTATTPRPPDRNGSTTTNRPSSSAPTRSGTSTTPASWNQPSISTMSLSSTAATHPAPASSSPASNSTTRAPG
ncbi:MAG: Rieske 2Fe-2S domain-containing protein [Acidimicrobiales bacterium]